MGYSQPVEDLFLLVNFEFLLLRCTKGGECVKQGTHHASRTFLAGRDLVIWFWLGCCPFPEVPSISASQFVLTPGRLRVPEAHFVDESLLRFHSLWELRRSRSYWTEESREVAMVMVLGVSGVSGVGGVDSIGDEF